MALRVCNLFTENLSKNSNIDDSEISLHIFPLELIQNYKILV